MDIGICVASRVGDLEYVVRAEELGYSHAWFADVQMLWSDPYAAAALAAERTSTIEVGTGVSVAATRPSVVTAASMATVNQLAPGRTFCGIGTGNTAVRIMGLTPMGIAEFDRYLGELKPLLRGQEALVTWRGTTSPVRHIMADRGFVNFDDPMPLYVSGFGPRSMALAGKHGDGIVLSIPLEEPMMERVWRAVESGAAEVGRVIDRSSFYTATLTTIVVLEPGESPDSDRVREHCGAFAIASLHYAYDQWRNYGRRPSNPAVVEVWEDYCALLDQVPEPIRHQRIHQGHNCWVVPEEQRFVTSSLMQSTCLIGEPDEIVARLGALDAAGLDQVMILPPFDVRFEVLEAVGREIIPRL
ncbi:MAG: LLM class flavin-dependent oxidoreductase [Acidimicrobiia bacterium]|nr:LLM class flavin-dependent oxidoreductase [Acidimicrobiia bacterium]